MRSSLGQACAACLLFLLAAACSTPRALISGRVVADGTPVVGARVVAEEISGAARGEALSSSDGTYSLPALPAGTYRLRAETGGPRPLVAVPGRSPLRASGGTNVWVGLQAVPKEEPTRKPLAESSPGFGALSGVALQAGKPVRGAIVYLYLSDAEDLKGPGFRQSLPTGDDGVFAVDEVPEGAYYVATRKRADASAAGPVREGDLYGVASSNPVRVDSGEETHLQLHLVRKEKDEDPNQGLLALRGTGARGTVVDASGRPVAGLYVFAYRNRTIGHGMPDFVTLPTGPDGSFVLPLGEGGVFYLGAREKAGGSPMPGERFGFYEGTADHGLRVEKGRIVERVTIVVRKVLEP